MKLSVFADESNVSFEHQIEAVQILGLSMIEVRALWGTNVVELSDEDLSATKKLLDAANVTVSAIGSPVGKSKVTSDLAFEIGRLDRAIRAAELLGTNLVRVFSFYCVDMTADRGEVIRRMTALTRIAEQAGVCLVHENESGLYGDTPERCRDLIDSVGSPSLRSCFDPANFIVSGVRPFEDAWPVLADTVAHVHVKDAIGTEIVVAGEGQSRWPDLLDAMRGYDGVFTLEPHLSRVPDFIAVRRATKAFQALTKLGR